MRTTGNDAEPNNEYVVQPTVEESQRHFFRHDGIDRQSLDELSHIELKLKALWSEYIEHQEKFGFDDRAKALKEKYFSLYQSYRRNKNWKQAVSNNQ